MLTRHPLQPYDARNFDRERPFSFDTAALGGARSAWSVRHEPPPLLGGPLPPAPERMRDDVSLQDLKAFLVHPVRAFLRERLDVSTPFEPDDLADAIPVTLDNLEKWQIGDHLLRELLAGQDPVAVMTAEQLRGTLPPGGLGTAALDEVVARVPEAVGQHRRRTPGRAALGRRGRRPRRRPPAHRHRARRLRQPGRLARLLPAQARDSGCRPGSTCWR